MNRKWVNTTFLFEIAFERKGVQQLKDKTGKLVV
jgi:hypothetical protein